MNADVGSSISTNVVLIRSELAAFGRDALQLFLSGSVGIPNLHAHSVVANSHAMILADDLLAFFTGFETESKLATVEIILLLKKSAHVPSKANTTTVAHTITQNLT